MYPTKNVGNGRHTGHADLIREAVDGRIGEDPPDGWRPSAVHSDG
jgi:hypothetical protein